MYNEDRKQEYISSLDDLSKLYIKKNIVSVLNSISDLEKRLDKDLCDFSVKDIESYFYELNTVSYERIVNILSIFRRYVDWCIKKNYTDHNYINDVDSSHYKKYVVKIESKIIGRKELLELIEQLYNPRDQVFILGLFEGVGGKCYSDFYEMKITDIEGNILHLSDRDIKISDTLKHYMELSNSTMEYIVSSNSYYSVRPFYDNGCIVKATSTIDSDDEIKANRLRVSVLRSLKFLGIDKIYTIKDIIKSGKIDFINNEAKRLNLFPEVYCIKYSKKIENQFKGKFNTRKFINEYKDYLKQG